MDYQGKAAFCKNTKYVCLFHFADIGTKEATVGESASVTAGAPNCTSSHCVPQGHTLIGNK